MAIDAILSSLAGGPPLSATTAAAPVGEREKIIAQLLETLKQPAALPVPAAPTRAQQMGAAFADALIAASRPRHAVSSPYGDRLRMEQAQREAIMRQNAIAEAEARRTAATTGAQLRLGQISAEEERAYREAMQKEERDWRAQQTENQRRWETNQAKLNRDLQRELASIRSAVKEAKIGRPVWDFFNDSVNEVRQFVHGNRLSSNPEDRVTMKQRLEAGELNPLDVIDDFESRIRFAAGQTAEETDALQNGLVSLYKAEVLPQIGAYLAEKAQAGGLILSPRTMEALLDGQRIAVQRVMDALTQMEQQQVAERAIGREQTREARQSAVREIRRAPPPAPPTLP